MKSKVQIAAVLVISAATIALFQNCAGQMSAPSSTSVASVGVTPPAEGTPPAYVELAVEAARAMVEPLEADCRRSFTAAATLPANSQVVVRGSAIYNAQWIRSVRGTGSLAIKGSASEAVANEVRGFTGSLLACGITLEEVNGLSVADLTVDGGTVKSIAGLTGDVVIIGADFPEQVTGFRGTVAVKLPDGQYAGRTYAQTLPTLPEPQPPADSVLVGTGANGKKYYAYYSGSTATLYQGDLDIYSSAMSFAMALDNRIIVASSGASSSLLSLSGRTLRSGFHEYTCGAVTGCYVGCQFTTGAVRTSAALKICD